MQTILDRILSLKGDKTINAFARHIGCSPATLNDYQNGRRRPTSRFIMKVCMAYHVPIEWILGMTDERTETVRDTREMIGKLIVALLEAEREIAFLKANQSR